MEILLYRNNSMPNALKKSTTQLGTINGTVKDNVSVSSPEVIVSRSDAVMGCNYAKIATFGRYYFVVDKVILDNNRVLLKLDVDVLESFSDLIKSCYGYVTEASETDKDSGVIGSGTDSQIPTLPLDEVISSVDSIYSPILDVNGRFILTVLG